MSIWNKILIGLIIVASLVFFYTSSRMLKTQKYWSDLAEKYNKRIEELQKNDKLCEVGGTINGEFKPGIEQVRAELNKLTVDRQRVWYNCDPKVEINRQSGAVSVKVTIDQPNPSGIANKSILYAFEEAPTAQKGQFLGEFKVTAVADKQITLEPAFKITKMDLDKLAQAKRPWDLYDSLPHDNHEILSQLSEQDKKAMLPADSAAEYIDDGKQAAQGAPPQQIVDGKYVRPLRRYDYLFDMYRLKITELVDKEEADKRDKQMVDDTLADAQRQVQFYQDQVKVIKIILAKIERQRDAVKAHLDKLKEKFAEAKSAVADLIKNNKAMAGQIAKIQLDATRRIDERTRAMAQSANGEK
jgi:DNA repair exonuclease SbcCD ATPase subunit